MAVREGYYAQPSAPLPPPFSTSTYDRVWMLYLRAHMQMVKSAISRTNDVVFRAILGQITSCLAMRILFAPGIPWNDAVEVEPIVGLIMRGIGTTEARKDYRQRGEAAIALPSLHN